MSNLGFNIPDLNKFFYFNDPATIYDRNFHQLNQFDIEKIKELKKYSLVIANLSSEHYGRDTIDIVYDCFESCNINFILLSHEINDHQRREKLFFYPHWYHWARANFKKTYRINVSTIEKKYNVSCLNAHPRFQRIYNFLILRKKPYFKDWLFSMHQATYAPFRHDDYTLPPEYVSEWEQIQPTLEAREELVLNTHISSNTLNPAYTDSYINLVTEVTVIPKIFVSEKTWKPIANAQLFLIIGNPGTVDYLRNAGVDVFDDIIDHAYYDNEPNWEQRIKKVHELLESLTQQDLYTINKHTQDRRIRNAERFFNGEFDTQYWKFIQDHAEKYNN
jgi:hypothetical protein